MSEYYTKKFVSLLKETFNSWNTEDGGEIKLIPLLTQQVYW